MQNPIYYLSFSFFARERTTLMSVLSGIGMAIFPLAEFLSGQLYQVS